MKLFFSVGEPSGDLHGANLVRELRQQDPHIRCVGYGGPRMRQAGCEVHADLTELAVMWFLQAILNLHRFWGLLVQADRYFRHQKPDAVILIDYPGFNWWIARRAKAHGIPVFYYGAPQMWAWAPWRIRKMRRLVDHVLCKLPFEADWYCERGCHASYVGHPYFDELEQHQVDHSFIQRMNSDSSPLITLLPGSRTQEVTSNLSQFMQVVERIQQRQPNTRFAIASFNEKQADLAEQAISAAGQSVEVFVGKTPELIMSATACVACSGSVSLELLYHRKPTVIVYQVSRLAFRVQRYFRKVRYITLVNLLYSDNRYCSNGELYDPDFEKVPFPEYLTCDDRSPEVAQQIGDWIESEESFAATVANLDALRSEFAQPGATQRAAQYIRSNVKSAPTPRVHYFPPEQAGRSTEQSSEAA